MATIFIFHSQLDKELVYKYTTELRKHNHEVLIDDTLISSEKETAEVLMEAQRKADGTLVFLTRNSIQSVHVVSELGIAKAYEQNGKFFIPLLQREVSIPYILEKTQYIIINEENFLDTAEQIETSIRDFLSLKRKTGDDIPLNVGSTGERVKEVQNLLTQIGPSKIMADGIYGNSTVNAVTAFQKDNHLFVTGEVDQSTYETLQYFSTNKKEEKTEISQTNYWLLKINEKYNTSVKSDHALK
ncbi:TIR domain-containing protein [Rhodocytophaga rosea]|uniref:TIR domain-containing protein n=1 Tax=Rhodocytophaga rosea TaxID=2704465 RepID=A0A6C0GC06_9BACT|nr:peptidoglycan-binding protein [Rhodocytophaga rosea]QHT65352.1 TIR domain-containing protein [Rhodocytophaga rosea]